MKVVSINPLKNGRFLINISNYIYNRAIFRIDDNLDGAKSICSVSSVSCCHLQRFRVSWNDIAFCFRLERSQPFFLFLLFFKKKKKKKKKKNKNGKEKNAWKRVKDVKAGKSSRKTHSFKGLEIFKTWSYREILSGHLTPTLPPLRKSIPWLVTTPKWAPSNPILGPQHPKTFTFRKYICRKGRLTDQLAKSVFIEFYPV